MTREVEARLKISAVDRTGSVLKNVGNRLTEVNRRVEALNRMQQSSLAMMSRFIGPAALTYGLKEAMTQFAETERRMTRLGITAGVSREQTQAATDALRKLASQYAMSFDDVVKGLDTLVSSGLSLEQAMAFLPSVLKTAQATGSATEDIANTALKASSALKITAADMDKAFDIMVTGGKAGQFELKDMAQYIPGLANSFATLGYEGEDGLKKLIAVLQTIREDTGDASSAATQAQNVFGKMYSEETANKFKKFGIDLRKEMDAARAAGKDALTAFVDLSKQAIKGDLSKLPLLFSDQEFRLGMQSLITSPESLEKFLKLLNSADVNGTVLRDLGTVLEDTKAKIDRMPNSWDGFVKALGGATADVASPALDAATQFLDDRMAEEAGLKKFRSGDATMDQNSIDEFYKRSQSKKLSTNNWNTYDVFRSAIRALGRGEATSIFDYLDKESMRTDSTGVLREQYGLYRPGKGPTGSGIPIPVSRPRTLTPAEQMAAAYRLGDGRIAASGMVDPSRISASDRLAATLGDGAGSGADAIRQRGRLRQFDKRRDALQDIKDPSEPFSLIKSMKMGMDVGVFKEAGDQIKQGASEGGDDFRVKVQQAANDLVSAVSTAAAKLANVSVNVNTNNGNPKVNANIGRTDTFARAPGTSRQ